MHNLLVQFDEKGVVQQVREVPTEKLVEEFRTWIVQGQEPPLELSSAVEVKIQHHNGKLEQARLTLTKDAFVFHESRDAKHDFRIAPEKIASITTAGAFSRPNDPSFLGVTIHYSQKTPVGGKMTFQTTPSDLFVLMEYLQQVNPLSFRK